MDPAQVPGAWTDSVEFWSSVKGERKQSTTMTLDKSQPPTPDGTGLPVNFQVVADKMMYRSSYPSFLHFDELTTYGIKTVVTLVDQPIDSEYANWMEHNGIEHHQIHIMANKDPAKFTDEETVNQVVRLMLEPQRFPILIHCNKGKHRTGTMVACFRKVCGWSNEDAIREYVRYATPKERDLDKAFIERYNHNVLKGLALDRNFVGGTWKPPQGMSLVSNQSSAYTAYTLEPTESVDDTLSVVPASSSVARLA